MRASRLIVVSVLSVALSSGVGSCSPSSIGGEVESSAPVAPVTTPSPTATTIQTSVPDVIGMNAEQAIDTIELMGLKADVDGGGRIVIIKSNWTVVETKPAPEAVINAEDTVTLVVEKQSDEDDDARLTKTDDGLTSGMAMTVCTRAGSEQFPYGFEVEGFGGHIEVRRDSIYIDVEVAVTNESNATRTTHMECTVSGSDDRPKIDDLLVY